MEPTIYKTGSYKTTGIYKGAGGIYKGRGVYNDGEDSVSPEGLISLFYGDFSDGDYKFRWTSDKIYQITPNAGGNTNNYAINTTRKENTPLGDDTPVFKYGDPDNLYYLMGYLTPDSFPFGTFTTDFWFYCKPDDYELSGISRFIANQLRIRSIDNRSTKNINFGPHANSGVYYNLTEGAVNVDFVSLVIDTWHHIEVDFDYNEKKLWFYIDGMQSNKIDVSNTALYNYFKSYDYFHASRVTNDSRNHPNVKITQLALWDKLMNGQCYGMGLYHDGNKFLI